MTHIRSRPSRPGSNFSPRMARAGLEELASAPDHQSFGRYHEEQGDQRQYRRHDAPRYHRCKQRKKAGGSDSSDSTGSDSRIIRFWSGIRSPTQTTQTGQRARSSQDPRNARDAAPLTGERKAVDENEDHTGAVKTSIQFTAWAPNLRTTVPPVRSALAIQRPVTMMLPRNTTAPAMWAPLPVVREEEAYSRPKTSGIRIRAWAQWPGEPLRAAVHGTSPNKPGTTLGRLVPLILAFAVASDKGGNPLRLVALPRPPAADSSGANPPASGRQSDRSSPAPAKSPAPRPSEPPPGNSALS